MLRIVLCDDEPITLKYYDEQISRFLKEMETNCEIDLYTDSGKLLTDLYGNKRWDIYFLDLDMPTVKGLDLGLKIHELDPRSYLNYVTIHSERVYESLKTRPFRFIPKDEFHLHIEDCLKDILKDMRKDTLRHHIFLETRSAAYRFEVEEIMYVQSMDKYIRFYFRNGSASDCIRYRMGDVMEKLQGYGFIRIHKSYLVNYTYIQKILNSGIILDTGCQLPASRIRIDEIKSEYRRLVV